MPGGDRPNDTRFVPSKRKTLPSPAFLAPPRKTKVPSVPKTIRDYEKKSPAQKLKEYGFEGASANDAVALNYRKAVALEKTLRSNALNTQKAEPISKAIVERNKARSEVARIEAIPWGKRPKGWVPALTAAREKADYPLPISDAIVRGLLTHTDAAKDYLLHDAWKPSTSKEPTDLALAGLPIPPLRGFTDPAEMIAKSVAGIGAGAYGALRHPHSGPSDVGSMAGGFNETLGMILGTKLSRTPSNFLEAVPPPVSGSEQGKTWSDYVKESGETFNAQYGPGVPWRSSLSQSSKHPVSAVLTGLGVAAPVAKGFSIAAALGKGTTLGEAVALARVPAVPRTFRLAGGEDAMGQVVEGTWARSPLMRAAIQRPADMISGKISTEARGVGRFSESARAAKIVRKNLKRDTLRAEAEAANYLHGIGRKGEAEELRAVYMRGKPDGVDEETWLKARVDDVQAMLEGREMILPGKPDPQLTKLRNRVKRLQQKFDKRSDVVDERTIARKLEPLRNEERSLRAKVRSARERGLPAEEIAPLTDRLKNVQEQLAVARGHDVGSLPDTPARAQMREVIEQALEPDQAKAAMEVVDLTARAASPDNPDAFFQRVTTRWAENPEEVSLDTAALLQQQAGQRVSLGGGPMSPVDVRRAFENGYNVETPDGRRGKVTAVNYDDERATITTEDGQHVSVPFEQIVDPNSQTPIFYSKAQRLAVDLPPKASPDQIRAFFTKRGVKPVEMEWAGIDDWLDALNDSGIKSLTREEVIAYFANPQNAFDLNETLWEQGAHPHQTRWGQGDYNGVALYDVGGEYKELMIQLPGIALDAGSRARSHMPGIDNPVVQIRFHVVGNKIVIDELQSDWGTALRDVGYRARKEGDAATRNALNVRRTQIIADLVERIQEKLGIHYDALTNTNEPLSIVRDLQDLGNKMDAAWREHNAGPDEGRVPLLSDLEPSDPRVDMWNEWLATPERAAVSRMMRHADTIYLRANKLATKVRELHDLPHDQPYKKTWSQLGLKRMVAWAVAEGYDSISWPQGIVPAVRYGKVEPGDHLSPVSGSRGNPEDHPYYPSENSYERGYVYKEAEFATPDAGPTQDVLFGQAGDRVGYHGATVWGSEVSDLQLPQGVPMGLTTPARYDKEMLLEAGFDLSYELDDLHPGQMIHVETGPLANQFIRITKVDSEGIEATPSGIESIEIQGDSDNSGYQNLEVTIRVNGRSEYLSGSDLGDAFRDGTFDDITDSAWFDDMDGQIDRSWESETDQDAYDEAVSDFMDRWNDGEYDDGNYSDGLLYDPDEIAELDYSHYKGLADLYNNVIPSDAKKDWGKKYGITIEKSYVEGRFTAEGEHAVSEIGRIPTWEMRIPPEMAEDVRQGQTFFQTAQPISGAQGVEIKGAVELMANRKFRLTLFSGADLSTVIHELGHIALHDIDPDSLNTIERDLAGGRPLAEWSRDDHERFARAWERFFTEGYASTTSLRRSFAKIMDWMRRIYYGLRDLGEPISPEVQRVFEKRLGKVGMDEADRRVANPELQRWGVLLSDAKDQLESYEMRVEIARTKGTDEAIKAEINAYRKQQEVARSNDDLEQFDRLTGQIRAAQKELDDRDALNAARGARREKLLTTRLGELNKALKKPDARRYAGATAAADYFQGEREAILRTVFGDLYDEVFAGRRAQESEWLAARGMLDPDLVGEGHGFLPFRRPTTERARVKEAAASLTRKVGKPRTNELNLHTRNQMILWQQGDYSASIEVLHEQYLRALSFGVQNDLRTLLHEIGEPVDASGPKDGWYLIDLDATPLPREWKSANTSTKIDSDLESLLDGLTSDDGHLALSLTNYVENWMRKVDATTTPNPEGGWGNVRQVHPNIINRIMLPYTGPMNTVYKAFQVPNTLARLSLIYANPGYIPSNVMANFILLVAERGVFALPDLFNGATMVMKDRVLARRVGAEMGETHTTAYLRQPSANFGSLATRAERWVADKESFVADDWMRAAAWSGIASKRGYKGRAAQLRLLDGRTEKTRRDRNWVSDKATNAMINFDKLAPWEQKYLRPIVFVWPFIRGATAWPLDYTMEHPFRVGVTAAFSQSVGEEGQEELGPTPVYYPNMALVGKKGTTGSIMDMQSISPIGPLGEMVSKFAANIASAVNGKPTGPFLNLAGFFAPQYDEALKAIQNRGDFGQEQSIRETAATAASSFVPGLGIWNDVTDETKPAVQMDQGLIDTMTRRTLRFSPQKVNLAILNQQAKDRGAAETVSQKKDKEIRSARSAWNHITPGHHMPRIIEQSIESYYSVQELRTALKGELKRQKNYQPTKREPTLTPLQEAAVVYDVFAARFPEAIADAPDPHAIFEQYGEEAVGKYRTNLERSLFAGKRAADKAQAAAKKLKKAAA